MDNDQGQNTSWSTTGGRITSGVEQTKPQNTLNQLGAKKKQKLITGYEQFNETMRTFLQRLGLGGFFRPNVQWLDIYVKQQLFGDTLSSLKLFLRI